ncbi:MAG: hypothetical protein HY505_01035 [Candidatus Yanofskybacteria bacterium]|nr:hypothetical protein [Candidatus Yanofskybacteria bacterium]
MKQFIYGALYLTVIGAVIYGLYWVVIQPGASCFDNRRNQGEEEVDCGGPCLPCALKTLKSLEVSTTIFPIGGNTNLIINFSNPNLDYGAESFGYTINFKNSAGSNIFSLERESFIYPAEVSKTIIDPNLPVSFSSIFGLPEIIIGDDIIWKSTAEFFKPRTSIRQIRAEISGTTASVTGILTNQEPFGLNRVVASAVISKKSNNKPIGASKTILQDIQPFEERGFKITVPISEALNFLEADTQVFVDAVR